MPDSMSRTVEKVEGAVAEVIMRGKSAYLEAFATFREVYLTELAPSVVRFFDGRVFIRRVAGGVVLLEAGAND